MSSVSMGDVPAPTWPVLTIPERRVLGVLVEKAKTTPDSYPLSINALVTGCNQKSNRDPVLDLGEEEVEEALSAAQQKGLAIKITGGRVVRWRHALYEAWHADKIELAILAELLLRGPQTEGELRSWASRMEPIADLETLRTVIRRLAERKLIVYLTPENRRGTTITHGFYSPVELEQLRRQSAQGEVSTAVARGASSSGSPDVAAASEARAANATSQSAHLQARLEEHEALINDLSLRITALERLIHGRPAEPPA